MKGELALVDNVFSEENEFEIISFKDILSGVVNIVDKKVGE